MKARFRAFLLLFPSSRFYEAVLALVLLRPLHQLRNRLRTAHTARNDRLFDGLTGGGWVHALKPKNCLGLLERCAYVCCGHGWRWLVAQVGRVSLCAVHRVLCQASAISSPGAAQTSQTRIDSAST